MRKFQESDVAANNDSLSHYFSGSVFSQSLLTSKWLPPGNNHSHKKLNWPEIFPSKRVLPNKEANCASPKKFSKQKP